MWDELRKLLDSMAKEPHFRMDLKKTRRFHYLYQRASADLAKIMTFSSEPEIRRHLESLVERAYGEIHETRAKPHRLAPFHWFFHTFPQTFRRHVRVFWLCLAIMLLGSVFGGLPSAWIRTPREPCCPGRIYAYHPPNGWPWKKAPTRIV